jgi:nitroimidazol reductase NimA-like FMN-containing flavoprotein (pyridoxamine 5'-phosphate oxidase superfamily)
MVIHEMTLKECHDALAQANLARLACERDGQAYVVPVYLIYDGKYLYGFSTLGQKIEWMRANSLVCVEIDDVKSQNRWTSVVVDGIFEELPDTPEHKAIRLHAHQLLQKHAMWWEPACVAVEHRDSPNSVTPIFYRIRLDRMTGHRCSPDSVEGQPAPATNPRNWLSSLLDRVATRLNLFTHRPRDARHGWR